MRSRSGLGVVSRQDAAKQERRLLSRRERATRFLAANPVSAASVVVGAALVGGGLAALVHRKAANEGSVRVFVHTPRDGNDPGIGKEELALLERLPHKCTTLIPENKWKVADGTAVLHATAPESVYDNGTRTRDYGIAAAASEWFGALVKLRATWERIVVIVVTSAQSGWEPSYTCEASEGGKKHEVTFTSYAGEKRNALVFAPDCVVLIDEQNHAFFSCTLIRNMHDSQSDTEITRADYCAGVDGTRLRAESMYLCHQKVLAFAREEKGTRQRRKNDSGIECHEIDGHYERIFVTSDTHADLRKLVQILSACGLITIENGSHEDIYAVVSHDQMVHELVWSVKWAARKTMLVICGDLVDGQRRTSDGASGTGDDRGSYEFLLHCLLFNLRIQARRMDSEVQFTIGNHDAGTVTGYKESGSVISPWTYVEQVHWTFAPSCRSVEIAKTYRQDPILGRRDMLLPFYACSPYIMLTFGKVAFVHAGFVWGPVRIAEGLPNNAEHIFRDAMQMQQSLDDAPLDEGTDLVKLFEITNNAPDVIWARGYAQLDHDGACDRGNPAHKRFELIAVGHCITHDHKDKNLVARQCGGLHSLTDATDATGCVLTRDCDGGPLIALVDTGMAAAFRGNGQDNATRAVGILLLDEKELATEALRTVGGHHVYRIRALNSMELIDHKGDPVSVLRFGQSSSARHGRYV